MPFRQYLSESSRTAVVGAIVVLVLAVFLILKNMRQPSVIGESKWMFDLNSQKIVSESIQENAPADLTGELFAYEGMKSAGATVDAMIFTCGDPTDIEHGMTLDDLESVGARLGYLVRYTDDSVGTLSGGGAKDSGAGSLKVLVALHDELRWIPDNSRLAERLKEEARFRCPDDSLSVRTRPVD